MLLKFFTLLQRIIGVLQGPVISLLGVVTGSRANFWTHPSVKLSVIRGETGLKLSTRQRAAKHCFFGLKLILRRVWMFLPNIMVDPSVIVPTFHTKPSRPTSWWHKRKNWGNANKMHPVAWLKKPSLELCIERLGFVTLVFPKTSFYNTSSKTSGIHHLSLSF